MYKRQGYSNEKTLLELAPAYIKLDLSIIRDIDSDPDKQQIVENIVSYAHQDVYKRQVWTYYNGDQLASFERLVEEFNTTIGKKEHITEMCIRDSAGGLHTDVADCSVRK